MASTVLRIFCLFVILFVSNARVSTTALARTQENNELVQFNSTSNSGTHIFVQLLLQQGQLASRLVPSTRSFESALKAIVQQEVNGDWNRTIQMLPLLNRVHSSYLKEAVYETLWQELRVNRIRLNPFLLIDFYIHADAQSYLNATLKQNIKEAVVARSAQILEMPFYATGNHFPLITNILQHIENAGQALFAEVMAALYDAVLLLQPPAVVVQRLSQLTASTKQFAQAYLLLKERQEVANSTTAKELLTKELVELINHSDFASIPKNLSRSVNASLPIARHLLANASQVCIRNATNVGDYIYECSQTFLMCSNGRDPKKAAYRIERQQHGAFGEVFSFSNSYWSNRYLKITTNITASQQLNATVKNVYSHAEKDWLQVRYVDNFVALLDNSGARVVCAGSPSYWSSGEHHVYTRPKTEDFQWDTAECLWQIEDCGF